MRQVWLALLVSAAVLFPRTALVLHSQSERVDDEYHLRRGIHYLKRHLDGEVKLPLNDPPMGEGLTALPMFVVGCWPRGLKVTSALYGYKWSADAILMLIGMWKVLLFLPCVAVVFVWCRRLYGVRAAWLAVALVLVEPTIAAHVGLPTLDVLGVEGIVIACWLWWRFFENVNWTRLLLASVMTGVALMLKHTAVIIPGVVVVMAVAWWWKRSLRGVWRKLLAAPVIVALTIWALCFFDFSAPPLPLGWADEHPKLARVLEHRWPAAMYVGSFLEAQSHAEDGHPSYLFGQRQKKGVWYYFPVVATYKVPIGIAAVMALALISLWKQRIRWDEWSLLISMAAWTALMLSTNINIGWRHFLPAYLFMLMWSSRVALVTGLTTVLAWSGIAIAAAHGLMFHPDYLSYINFPRQKAYLQISDSNVDWGQGLKDVLKWLEKHPGRKVFVRDFGWGPDRLFNVKKRIGDRATVLDRGDKLPREGVLIISPVPVAGVYERSDVFRVLRDVEPDEVLGHAMLVYDLDRLRNGKAFYWPRYRPTPVDEKGNPKKAPEGAPQNAHPWG